MLAAGPTTTGAIRVEAEPVAAEVLKRIYTRAGGRDPGLSRAHIAAMLRLAEPGRGGRGVDLPGGSAFPYRGGAHAGGPIAARSPVVRYVWM